MVEGQQLLASWIISPISRMHFPNGLLLVETHQVGRYREIKTLGTFTLYENCEGIGLDPWGVENILDSVGKQLDDGVFGGELTVATKQVLDHL